jgi:hypothetical protein
MALPEEITLTLIHKGLNLQFNKREGKLSANLERKTGLYQERDGDNREDSDRQDSHPPV